MLKNKVFNFSLEGFFFIFVIFFTYSYSFAEVIILSDCKNENDKFKKNEYILDLDKSLMTRNFIYNKKTYEKYRLTDLSTKENNSVNKFIYVEDNLILSDKVGYPQFYTQLLFEKNIKEIRIKTVINGEPGITLLSKCKTIEIFESES